MKPTALRSWVGTALVLTVLSLASRAHAGGGCPADIEPSVGNGFVNVSDLLALIGAWGSSAPGPDINDDNIVNVSDLLLLIGSWGICSGHVDNDGDGWTAQAGDCNDSAPSINPGAAEVCNGIDDNCNGQTDDGLPGDTTANTCAAAFNLGDIPSTGSLMTFTSQTLYPAGDEDWLRFSGVERGTPPCFPGTDQPYVMRIRLTVPALATGSYRLETRLFACTTTPNVQVVAPGNTGEAIWNVEGECGSADQFPVFIRVVAHSAPAWSCQQYILQATFDEP